jgi:hypothetical protein
VGILLELGEQAQCKEFPIDQRSRT